MTVKGYITIPCDDGERTLTVLVQTWVGSLGNFGNPTVGGFENVPGELLFDLLSRVFDFRCNFIQFMDIK